MSPPTTSTDCNLNGPTRLNSCVVARRARVRCKRCARYNTSSLVASILAPRVLIVTDQYNYGRLLEQHLSTIWSDVETKVHAPNHSGRFHPGFTAAGFDCVLLDHEVEGTRGMDWLADFSKRKGFPPVMYFAPGSDISVGQKAIQNGAEEWFMRERIHNRRFASVISDHV